MSFKILVGDCRTVLKTLPDASVNCCVTSPPYWGLRDYGVDGQLGLEPTPEAYVANLVDVFGEVRRVLRDDGTLWLNLGDSYAAGGNGGDGDKQHSNRGTRALAGKVKKAPEGLKPKDLVGIPWRVAFALQADGWWLRSDIIWAKPNPMPESVTDRPTKAHEYVFLLAKAERYYYDAEAIKEPSNGNLPWGRATVGSRATNEGAKPRQWEKRELSRAERIAKYISGRNKRSVWTVATQPYSGAHFATFPPDLIRPCILAGCPAGGTVLDPFGGAGTTGLVAERRGRNSILIELNSKYAEMAQKRIERHWWKRQNARPARVAKYGFMQLLRS